MKKYDVELVPYCAIDLLVSNEKMVNSEFDIKIILPTEEIEK